MSTKTHQTELIILGSVFYFTVAACHQSFDHPAATTVESWLASHCSAKCNGEDWWSLRFPFVVWRQGNQWHRSNTYLRYPLTTEADMKRRTLYRAICWRE